MDSDNEDESFYDMDDAYEEPSFGLGACVAEVTKLKFSHTFVCKISHVL